MRIASNRIGKACRLTSPIRSERGSVLQARIEIPDRETPNLVIDSEEVPAQKEGARTQIQYRGQTRVRVNPQRQRSAARQRENSELAFRRPQKSREVPCRDQVSSIENGKVPHVATRRAR